MSAVPPSTRLEGMEAGYNVDVVVLHEGMLIEDERMNEVRE